MFSNRARRLVRMSFIKSTAFSRVVPLDPGAFDVIVAAKVIIAETLRSSNRRAFFGRRSFCRGRFANDIVRPSSNRTSGRV